MKSGVLALLMVGVVLFGLGAGTWAYFSDTETSTGNYVAAGTLDLIVNGENPLTTNIDYTAEKGYVYPGWGDNVSFWVKNDGTIDGILYLDISYVDSPGETPEPEPTPDNGELSQYLYIKIYYSDDDTFDSSDLIWEGYVSGWSGEIELGELPAGVTKYIKVEASIADEAGNVIQGDSLTVDVTFTLEQDTS